MSWRVKNWFAKAPNTVRDMGKFELERTEAEWKKTLTDEQYYVLRQKGTERAGTGKLDKFYPSEGYFKCAACENPIYSAQSKFDSGCGWPAFDKHYDGSIKTVIDNSWGMRRIEIMCSKCGGHLGHVFEGERLTNTNERHCVNSISLKYDKGSGTDDLKEKPLMK
ncbi:hypothetical protein NDN08_005278 [Rhodosorus marinus]|uniref:Peptide-methionine (R)-S-oxide reductase n=1 Tax=Rhodosorus marinus TaxID=101924 RepID=A0AAV8V485_9RHOD|nr:hypothetical protein NDN08_005278 [Rhodosorus marinus]